MYTIGMTGGIGAGKSTVANLFAAKGINIVDTDQVAREVVTKEKPAFKEIVNHFGSAILTAQGDIDRAQLRQIIFNHAEQRQWLESLLHPIIWHEAKRRCLIPSFTETSYSIIVVPLLIESGLYQETDQVLVIDCPEEVQISRTQQRDNLTRQEVLSIMATQLSREQRLAQADRVIINNGSQQKLMDQINDCHLYFCNAANLNAGTT